MKPMCWVCGKQVGPKFFVPKFTFAIVRDPIGNEHPCHLICVKDADGKQVRTETMEAGFKPGERVQWTSNGQVGVVKSREGVRTLVEFADGVVAIDARTLTRA